MVVVKSNALESGLRHYCFIPLFAGRQCFLMFSRCALDVSVQMLLVVLTVSPISHFLSVDDCPSGSKLDSLESFFLKRLQRLVVEHTEF